MDLMTEVSQSPWMIDADTAKRLSAISEEREMLDDLKEIMEGIKEKASNSTSTEYFSAGDMDPQIMAVLKKSGYAIRRTGSSPHGYIISW